MSGDERLVAANVIRALKESSITQHEAAGACGISDDKFSKSLHGKRRFSSFELASIAELTMSRVDDLLGIHMADPAVQSAQILTKGILDALDYAADTGAGDWRISYHEAAQSMCGILRKALNDSLAAEPSTPDTEQGE